MEIVVKSGENCVPCERSQIGVFYISLKSDSEGRSRYLLTETSFIEHLLHASCISCSRKNKLQVFVPTQEPEE